MSEFEPSFAPYEVQRTEWEQRIRELMNASALAESKAAETELLAKHLRAQAVEAKLLFERTLAAARNHGFRIFL